MIKVSVIIPVYNVERYLYRSLNSLCNQTLKDIQIICIDDCSTDSSLKILKEYAAIDNRIIVLESERNLGAAIARNRGLEVANGEYLGFIDPDDEIDLNYYEELYNKAILSNADIVKCVRETINLNGQHNRSELNRKIEKNKFNFTYEWTTAIYKKSLIDENNIKFPEECIKAQDVVFLNRVILKSNKIELIDNVKYTYHRRENSLNANILPDKYVKSAVLAIEIITNEINASNLYEINKKDYVEYYARECFALITNVAFKCKTKRMLKLTVKSFIDIIFKCKDVDSLMNRLPYEWMKPYILNKKYNHLANLIYNSGYADKKELLIKPNSLIQNIFSIKNEPIKKRYKIITILGLKFKINLLKLRKIKKAIPYLLFPVYLFKNMKLKKKIHKKVCRIIRNQLSKKFENTYTLTKAQIRDFVIKNNASLTHSKKNIKRITNDIYDKFHFRKKHRILGIKFYTKNKHKELVSLLNYTIKRIEKLEQK